MCTLIGAEYLIGNYLIAKMRNGKRYVCFSELDEFGIKVKEYCDNKDLEVVLLLSSDQIDRALYNYSSFFECDYSEKDKERCIKLKESVRRRELEKAFFAALPLDALYILIETARKLAA